MNISISVLNEAKIGYLRQMPFTLIMVKLKAEESGRGSEPEDTGHNNRENNDYSTNDLLYFPFPLIKEATDECSNQDSLTLPRYKDHSLPTNKVDSSCYHGNSIGKSLFSSSRKDIEHAYDYISDKDKNSSPSAEPERFDNEIIIPHPIKLNKSLPGKEKALTRDSKKVKPKQYKKKRRYVKNNPKAVKLFDILKTFKCTKIQKFDYFKTKLMKIFDKFLSLLVENIDNLDLFLFEHFETISNDGSTIVEEILTELNNLPETFDLKSHIAIRRLEKKYDNTYLRRLFEPDPIKKILPLVFQIQYKDIPGNQEILSLFDHEDPLGPGIFQEFLNAFPYFSEE